VNPIAKPVGPFLKQKVKSIAVSVSQKDVLPAVAPKNDVIKSTRKVDASFTCHGCEHTAKALTCQHGSLTLFLFVGMAFPFRLLAISL